METNIIEIINKLKFQTEKRIKESMERRNVSKFNMSLVRVYERNDFGHHKKYYKEGTSLFVVRNFPYTEKTKMETYEETLDNLIASKKCYPFMLFLNGTFVKWSEILVIKEDKDTYIYLNNYDEDRPKRKVVLLPNIDIDYSEDGTDGIFIFGPTGKLVNKEDVHHSKKFTTISFNSEDVEYEYGNIVSNKIVASTKFDNTKKINKKNILVFKNGLFEHDDEKIKCHGANIFSVEDEEEVKCKYYLFYNNLAEDSVDNDTRIRNLKILQDNITKGQHVPEYLKKLNIPFNFEFDRKKTWEENLNDALTYILNYNPILINDSFRKECNIRRKSFSGKYLKSKKDDEGYVTMSRMYDDNPNNYILIFKNGYLYDYYYALTYDFKDFKFPVYYLEDDDNVEIFYLLGLDNDEMDIRFNSAADNDIHELGGIDLSHYKLYSDNLKETEFSNIITGDNMFEVEFNYKELGDGKTEIYPKDNYYFDKDLVLVNNRRFKYFRTIIQESNSDIYLDLPERFKYCYEYDNYIVFLNGKKLDNKSYLITIPKDTRPFDILSIYFNRELKAKDVVEIFYIGLDIKEVYSNRDLNINGNIVMDRSKLKFGFDKDLYFVFVNGRKVPYDDISEIDSNKLQILSGESTKNVSIMRLSNGYKTISDLFSMGIDLRTVTFNGIKDTGNTLFHENDINNTEEDINKDCIDTTDILNEIIHDFWKDWYNIDLGDFLLDFDQVDVELDEDGNFISKVYNRQE